MLFRSAALLGARGHQEARARYSWKTTFARIAEVYAEVVGESSPGASDSPVAKLLAEGDESAPAPGPLHDARQRQDA